MTHLHLTVILLTIIFFFITWALQKQGKNVTAYKMILRIFYLLLLASGGMLLFSVYKITFLYIVKSLIGLAMIGVFEMILLQENKTKKSTKLWISFVLGLIILIYLGLKLPLGFYF